MLSASCGEEEQSVPRGDMEGFQNGAVAATNAYPASTTPLPSAQVPQQVAPSEMAAGATTGTASEKRIDLLRGGFSTMASCNCTAGWTLCWVPPRPDSIAYLLAWPCSQFLEVPWLIRRVRSKSCPKMDGSADEPRVVYRVLFSDRKTHQGTNKNSELL